VLARGAVTATTTVVVVVVVVLVLVVVVVAMVVVADVGDQIRTNTSINQTTDRPIGERTHRLMRKLLPATS